MNYKRLAVVVSIPTLYVLYGLTCAYGLQTVTPWAVALFAFVLTLAAIIVGAVFWLAASDLWGWLHER